ncbi:hypothetical protein [Amycolatopsis sp. NPDC004378]
MRKRLLAGVLTSLTALTGSLFIGAGTAHADDCALDLGIWYCGEITNNSGHYIYIAEWSQTGYRLPPGAYSKNYINDVDQIWSDLYYVRIKHKDGKVTETAPYYRQKVSGNEHLSCKQMDSTIVFCSLV